MATIEARKQCKDEQWEALRIAESEGRFVSEYRKQGRDMFFQWYLLGQRVRIIGAHLARAIAAPVLAWTMRRLRHGDH